jgi:hypothetical protein
LGCHLDFPQRRLDAGGGSSAHVRQLLGDQVELQVEYSIQGAQLPPDQGDLFFIVHLRYVEHVSTTVSLGLCGSAAAQIGALFGDRLPSDHFWIVSSNRAELIISTIWALCAQNKGRMAGATSCDVDSH